MKTYGLPMPGVKIIQHVQHTDHRGSFCETWKTQDDGLRGTYRQLNTAVSSQFVIRGMHRQDQTKLVMPVVGKIFDVALDPATGQWFAAELDENSALLVPPEYAHGYMALSERCVVQYIVDAPYNKALEENFRWDQYNIAWPTAIVPVLSDKDR